MANAALKKHPATPRRNRQTHRALAAGNNVRQPWYSTTAFLGLLGAGSMWLAMPPVDWGPLAWIAPVCWLVLIRREHLQGARPYLVLYVAGLVYWGAAFAWIRKPHWSAGIGWVALTFYLAFYTVLFVGLSRVAKHRFRIPLVLAAPAVWTGLELVRAYMIDGFLMGSLAHTQYRWTSIIQISDICGAYGLTFLIMFIAACITTALPLDGDRLRWWPVVAAVAAIAAALGYGHWRMADNVTRPGPQVALIQGSIDTQFDLDPRVQQQEMWDEYRTLAEQAVARAPDVDLLIWPESMYPMPLILVDDGAYLPAAELVQWPSIDAAAAQQFEQARRLPQPIYDLAQRGPRIFRATVAGLGRLAQSHGRSKPNGPAMLIGVECERYFPGKVERYNTSVYLNGKGEIVDFYHKLHPVIFGEYVPFGDFFPWLYKLTPLPGGLTAGTEAKIYDVAGFKFCPNICYETVLPQVIRSQFVMLRAEGREPDVLVTQTNDGWFWGSAALDMHLLCGVFRAVECRKPLLIAANTGFSASIDADGRILQKARRRAPDILIAEPRIDSRRSFYLRYGDWFAHGCALFCGVLFCAGVWQCRRARAKNRNN